MQDFSETAGNAAASSSRSNTSNAYKLQATDDAIMSQDAASNSQMQNNLGDSPNRDPDNQSIFMTNLTGNQLFGPESAEQKARYTNLYDQLDNLANHIDSHYSQQLKTHESDFKKAYEGQMQKVRKELHFLKMKQNEANGALMNDNRITSLRRWIQWFKTKSMELDKQLNMQKSEHVSQV